MMDTVDNDEQYGYFKANNLGSLLLWSWHK